MTGRAESPAALDLANRSAGFLIPPRHGSGVCHDCFNLTRGYERCFACACGERRLATLVPISLSLGGSHVHHVLADYKRLQGLAAERATRELAAILTRFLGSHEPCVAKAAGLSRFDVVTTVPSGDARRDEAHPLRKLVAERVEPVRQRYERLLRHSGIQVRPRSFDARRFTPTRTVEGLNVLLIDDTWTTGASAQSAAAVLQEAGAAAVAAVVVGRHLRRGWHENDARVAALAGHFDWSTCAVCAQVNEVACAA
jgi:predicted amidophosphoribosyltransferase